MIKQSLLLGLALFAAASTSAQKHPRHPTPAPATKPHPIAPAPLTERERVVQLLDRFTFGPRPGEIDRVLAIGADKWIEQQLRPESIKDTALDRRLADYPTLSMGPQQAIAFFPDRQQVYAVADGKAPYPTDPLQNAVFEVQVHKWNLEKDAKKADGSTQPRPEPNDAEKAEAKKRDQSAASRIFGQLIALPKAERMPALIKLPVEDRIVLTANGNLTGEQSNLLLNDFTPPERETFRAMGGNVSSSYNIGNELAHARVLRDVLSERQLLEVMTSFWFNHFNVFIGKDSDQWYTTSYERDVIRKHALGSFRDLLLATAQSPAMMVYLDNWLSVGPNSIANGGNPKDLKNQKAKKRNLGLNENYGREVMELHTVGVNGGYTQADVTALAAILTGWGVDKPNQGGPFLFDPRRHEPGPKIWLGRVIQDDGTLGENSSPAAAATATPDSMQQGIAALNILAASPQTAHFISLLLAQYFVADDPPSALVDRLAATYLSSHGDIRTVLRTLVASPEFNSRKYFHDKVKTPVEFIASAFRSTATDPQNPGALVNTLKSMGMPLYNALPPTGYYLTADHWMNSTALVDRLNFAYQLTAGKYANQKFDSPRLLATGLMATELRASSPPVAPVAQPAGTLVKRSPPKLVGVAAPLSDANPATLASTTAGSRMAMGVLEATMIGAPVSPQTNELIGKQLAQQPSAATPTETLNLLTALILGSPDFQFR